jgi:hypothetical protein
MLDRITSHTLKDKTQERSKLENIPKCRHDKGQLVKLLSYHPMTTAIQLHMERPKAADGSHHLVFHSITSNIMNWPFLILFQLIMMKRRKKYIE